MKRLFLFLPALLSLSAYAAKTAPTTIPPQIKKEFVDACQVSFKASNAQTDETIAKNICECTAKDSGFEGVKTSSLKHEAEEIKKNPKYQIKDEKLMNAFRWCTIELMRKADASDAS